MTDKKIDCLTTGMAIFAMFFGAGNIIFPLDLGRQMLEKTPIAVLGLLITAVIVPFSGLLGMFLYEGQIQTFFGRIGKRFGLVIAFLIIALLGPLGSTPRCIALSFSTLNLAYPGINPSLFNAIACFLLFLMAYKKQRLLRILGYFLTPFLLILLGLIISKGFLMSFQDVQTFETSFESGIFEVFWKGLKEGYNTMDLLAAFFFAPVIIQLTQSQIFPPSGLKSRFLFIFISASIGAVLLSAVYIGFSLLASHHASYLQNIPPEDLLGVISLKILGPHAGIIVCLTVVLACLTTAVALILAFAGFIHREFLGEKWSYPWVLGASLLVTYVSASFEFKGISQFLNPVLEICYPFLILLTVYNILAFLKPKPQTLYAKQKI